MAAVTCSCCPMCPFFLNPDHPDPRPSGKHSEGNLPLSDHLLIILVCDPQKDANKFGECHYSTTLYSGILPTSIFLLVAIDVDVRRKFSTARLQQ
jgi:hypothetical protein